MEPKKKNFRREAGELFYLVFILIPLQQLAISVYFAEMEARARKRIRETYGTRWQALRKEWAGERDWDKLMSLLFAPDWWRGTEKKKEE